MARISPVRTLVTMPTPPMAPKWVTALASSSSTAACTRRSMDSGNGAPCRRHRRSTWLVQRQLGAGQAHPTAIDNADHVGGCRAHGIDALGFRLELDPRQAEIVDAVLFVGRAPARPAGYWRLSAVSALARAGEAAELGQRGGQVAADLLGIPVLARVEIEAEVGGRSTASNTPLRIDQVGAVAGGRTAGRRARLLSACGEEGRASRPCPPGAEEAEPRRGPGRRTGAGLRVVLDLARGAWRARRRARRARAWFDQPAPGGCGNAIMRRGPSMRLPPARLPAGWAAPGPPPTGGAAGAADSSQGQAAVAAAGEFPGPGLAEALGLEISRLAGNRLQLQILGQTSWRGAPAVPRLATSARSRRIESWLVAGICLRGRDRCRRVVPPAPALVR